MTSGTDRPVRRALLSVTDKTGLAEFARRLVEHDVEILSTGGTAAALREADIPVIEVSDHTGVPEILGGRVKTLHPRIHGGILARRDHAGDEKEMARENIAPIDLVVVNLYAFEDTVAAGASFEDCIESIDIGGPALIRASAKNHDAVTIVTDPADYKAVADEIAAKGSATSAALRRRLAGAAYACCAAYDAAIAGWFAGQQATEKDTGQNAAFPPVAVFSGRLEQTLRYGENPHQAAAFYRSADVRPGAATAHLIQGKALSYNNINDADAAFELVSEFTEPACVIVKHANPCGVATGAEMTGAWERALACDPVSAFGGVVAFNRPLDAATVATMGDLFLEVVVAPGIDDETRKILSTRKNLRLLETGVVADPAATGLILRQVAGGFLVQDRDAGRVAREDLKTVTKRAPTKQETEDLLFAFTVAKHVKSNAIVYARDGATVGIGAGQMSRVDASHIAARKGAEHAGIVPCVVASDAFFPFPDGLLAAVEAGATAVIQPGGSIRDDDVVAAADEAGIAMLFTAMRHFRH